MIVTLISLNDNILEVNIAKMKTLKWIYSCTRINKIRNENISQAEEEMDN